jgi:phosphoribosylglycinamide formyltransferase-1
MPPESTSRLRAAVLASGSGTILDAMVGAGIPIELVLLDRECDASGVAERRGVPCELIERTDFTTSFERGPYTQQVIDVLQKYEIDLVVMAGYGTILADSICEVFEGKIVNTHPALLPASKVIRGKTRSWSR